MRSLTNLIWANVQQITTETALLYQNTPTVSKSIFTRLRDYCSPQDGILLQVKRMNIFKKIPEALSKIAERLSQLLSSSRPCYFARLPFFIPPLVSLF